MVCIGWLLLPFNSDKLRWPIGKGLRTTITLDGFYDKVLDRFLYVYLAPQALSKNKLPFMPHGTKGAESVGRILQRYAKRCREEGKKA